ncbi:MAG: tetratricopeptide repeat protein [Rhodospirillales bacterium]|jgi:TPR repeat protein
MRIWSSFNLAVVLLTSLSAASLAGQREAERALKSGNYAKALAEFEELANRGDAGAQAMLGKMYARGQGVATNHSKAAELFRRAALQGDAEGAFQLGVFYQNGVGVGAHADKAEAAKWLRQSAGKGHPRAAYTLALMLLKGDGLPRSHDEGMVLMNQARRGQDMDAALYQRNQLDALGDQLKVRFEGGFGDGMETAVRIQGPEGKQDGAAIQRRFVETFFPGWQNYKQSLLSQDSKHIDAYEMTGPNGERETVYFDVTNWYGGTAK